MSGDVLAGMRRALAVLNALPPPPDPALGDPSKLLLLSAVSLSAPAFTKGRLGGVASAANQRHPNPHGATR